MNNNIYSKLVNFQDLERYLPQNTCFLKAKFQGLNRCQIRSFHQRATWPCSEISTLVHKINNSVYTVRSLDFFYIAIFISKEKTGIAALSRETWCWWYWSKINQALFKDRASSPIKIKKTMIVQFTFNGSLWYWLAVWKASEALWFYHSTISLRKYKAVRLLLTLVHSAAKRLCMASSHSANLSSVPER